VKSLVYQLHPPKPESAWFKPSRSSTALLIAACPLRSGQAATAETPGAAVHGRAYLFRGLIGLIDWGMDELAQRISRGGVAANIGSHLDWRSVANQAITITAATQADPVVGHSIAATRPWNLPKRSAPRMSR